MDGWKQYFTAEGNAYYYNETTGETSWDPPASLQSFDHNVRATALLPLLRPPISRGVVGARWMLYTRMNVSSIFLFCRPLYA